MKVTDISNDILIMFETVTWQSKAAALALFVVESPPSFVEALSDMVV